MAQILQSKQEQARQLRFARSKFRRINSLDLIPEDPNQENMYGSSELPERQDTIVQPENVDNKKLLRQNSKSLSTGLRGILFFWPNFFLNFTITMLRYILFIPFSIAAPSFWLSALLWVFWKCVRLPISLIKWLINIDSLTEASSGSTPHHKRTVLLSGGSTIQTLHLARNFYGSGSRVVVFEFEGLFGLARFSTAVDKFYIVPRPTFNNADSYITALCHIVNKEKPSVYIPVCATNPAFYDALVKQHLELLGCASFIPGLQETSVLDDCLQFFKKCAAQNISLPPYAVLTSLDDLWHLYENNFINSFRNILMAVGAQGLIERYKYILPTNRRDFKFNHDISEAHQWMVVRDLPGEHYVTCTTVKESRVVANVTCKVDHNTKNLIPVVPVSAHNNDIMSDEAQIDRWLKHFFAKVRFQRSINGHMSFRLIKCQGTGQFVPLGVRVGVSLPYICYNRSHAQVLCRTMKCVHMRPLSLTRPDEESLLATLGANFRWSTIERSSATAALDKREALFAYWDPLPYCAYYHFQLPLESVKMFLQRRHRSAKSLSPRITMPVH